MTVKIPVKTKLFIFSSVALLAIISASFFYYKSYKETLGIHNLDNQLTTTTQRLSKTAQELSTLKNQDQYKINKDLEKTIAAIETTYQSAVKSYEQLLDLKQKTDKTEKLDAKFSQALNLLSQKNYASASAVLTSLTADIQKANDDLVSSYSIPANIPVDNTPPASGYKRQSVQTDAGTFLVDIVVADLNSARVIVDTASDKDCSNDCPVASLADYAGRNGAFAGINGPYFCPAEYPSCADKKNTFDTLIMNKNKVYFNSSNNVYSTVPAVIFSGNSARWVGQSLEWGRDTGVDAVIASQPLLVLNGQVVFGGDSDPKRSSKGYRNFIGTTGSKVFIGSIQNATTAEAAKVIKTLGIDNALNLDSGGSTALWSGHYIAGPGRNTPFGILLVRK